MSQHDPLIAHMEEIGERLIADNDERQYFHGAYLRSTRAVMEDAAAGQFVDPAWAERWGLAFADLYMKAFLAWERGDPTPGPWQVAFDVSKDPYVPPVRHALLGINAHINYDLPQALLAVITQEEFDDDEVMALRASDHAHVDSILVQRVPEEDKRIMELEAPGDRNFVDTLMSPFNRAGTRRFLKEGRDKVWSNTRLLNDARRQGPDVYAGELAVLEALSQERVADLVTPRYVIMRLARHGFGVVLPPRATG
ncbi:MAG: DUF5995 family protein [Actinomycetota bacterium]|nr:DUF5995 family protein [Actinomycetota bacterium]